MQLAKKSGGPARLLKYGAAPALVLLSPNAADAAFIGYFDPTNWTLTNSAGGDGFVDTTGAPASIDLWGSDNGNNDNNTDYTIALNQSGFWSFSFSWDNQDISLGYDFGGYLLNGVFTLLGSGDTSGSVGPIAVNAGDVIGFRVACNDCELGRGVLTIRDFSAPASVPEPASLLLMAMGAAGLAAARRRRQN
jgi:hypothetical protein